MYAIVFIDMNLSARKHRSKFFSGFTLIELLVVIGILAVLLTIVLVAVNPARQFAQANDTKRKSDVTTILNAIGQFEADHKGVLPAGITTTAETIGTGTGNADICLDLMSTYVSALPVDPATDSKPADDTTKGKAITDCAQIGGYATGYSVSKDSASRVTVSAVPDTNGTGEAISITR